MKQKKVLKNKEEKASLVFLKRTQKGKYAKVEESSLSFSRLNDQRESSYNNDEEYYYSLR